MVEHIHLDSKPRLTWVLAFMDLFTIYSKVSKILGMYCLFGKKETISCAIDDQTVGVITTVITTAEKGTKVSRNRAFIGANRFVVVAGNKSHPRNRI